MDPDDHVCLCFHVSLRKIANFIVREEPRVPSQISECLGAGTGCQWCVPFLRKLHALHAEGKPLDLPVSPEEYASRRVRYRKTGTRDGEGALGTEKDAADESPNDERKPDA
ncbi:MAG: bacterioferritin-associated ferredoxin [bacterium]